MVSSSWCWLTLLVWWLVRGSRCQAAVTVAADDLSNTAPKRQIWTWVSGGTAPDEVAQKAQQLRHHHGLMDGIHLHMLYFDHETHGFTPRAINWEAMAPIVYAARDTQVQIEIWIQGVFPIMASTEIIESYIQSALHFRRIFETQFVDTQLTGFSFDDERDCAPRSNVTAFTDWMRFQNVFTTDMHKHNLTVSSAVQAMFGILQKDDDSKTAPCDKLPSAYPLEPQVIQQIQTATLDKWLVMDTYYFGIGRFLTSLDWYRTYFPLHQLAFGLWNDNDDLNDEGALTSRFYALHHSTGVSQINIFMLPIDERFIPFLRRWKTYCRGCGIQSVLGCLDMSIGCNDDIE